MEQQLGTSIGDLAAFIAWPYLLLFILLSYLIKKAFGDLLQKITAITWKPVYTVMALAAVAGVPYAIFTEATLMQVLITYTIGTSFYELILNKIIEGITKLFN